MFETRCHCAPEAPAHGTPFGPRLRLKSCLLLWRALEPPDGALLTLNAMVHDLLKSLSENLAKLFHFRGIHQSL